MAEASSLECLTFPKKLFRKHIGIGIDFGGSCFKLAYSTIDGDNIRIHLAIYSRERYEETLDFIKTHCQLEPDSVVRICGTSATEKLDVIKTHLNIKAEIMSEVNAMIDGFQFLQRNSPWIQFVEMPCTHAVEAGLTQARLMIDLFRRGREMNPRIIISATMEEDISPITQCDEVKYPVMLCLIGSVSASIIVREDGTYTVSPWNPLGGRSFLGLGGYLTNGKTFEELMSMAEAGDFTKVDQMFDRVGSRNDDASITIADNNSRSKGYGFGKLVGESTDSTEVNDVLAGVLTTITQTTAREMYMWSALAGIQQVFCYGSFVSSDVIKNQITAGVHFINNTSGYEHRINHHYVRHGSHLGAIGSLLANLELVE